MEQLKEFLKNKPVETILDIGTGTGDFIQVLSGIFPEANIFGVDPNAESLENAVQNYPDAEFQEMSAEELRYPDNNFDMASASMALHHFSDVPKSLAEMQRVVKPGGWIIIKELFSDNLNKAQEVHKLYHHFRAKIDRAQGISHNETFTKKQILDLIQDAGIQVIFSFETRKENNELSQPDIDERVLKMETALDKISGHPEYEELKPMIEEFRYKVRKYGFESATRIIVVGKVKL
ncbi:MAG: methyltransferase domain-containing protein [Bacteroidota bacterium]